MVAPVKIWREHQNNSRRGDSTQQHAYRKVGSASIRNRCDKHARFSSNISNRAVDMLSETGEKAQASWDFLKIILTIIKAYAIMELLSNWIKTDKTNIKELGQTK